MTDSAKTILGALASLDVSNDNHWTADGAPRLDTVKMLAGNPAITRDMVTIQAPGFTRSSAPTYTFPKEAESTASAAPAQAADSGAAATSTAAESDPPAAAEAIAGSPESGASTFSGAQPTEQPEVASGGTGSNALEALEAELAEAESDTQEIRQGLDYLKKKLKEATDREDTIRAKRDAALPKNGNALAIQDYFASQDKLRFERAQRAQALQQAGVGELLKNLKSPIDAAMARKNTRGAGRPPVNFNAPNRS